MRLLLPILIFLHACLATHNWSSQPSKSDSTMTSKQPTASGAAHRAKSIPFGTDKWVPLDPAHAILGKVVENGTGLVSKTVGGTDWWRTSERHSTNGPTLEFWREIGDHGFEIGVDIEVDPRVQYDQATIFLYVSPTQWLKAGIEYDASELWNGGVVCNPYSDWSIAKRNEADSRRFRVQYTPNELKVFLGKDMIREVKWFGPPEVHAHSSDKVFVGIMACSPKQGGADVSWADFTVTEGVPKPVD